MDIKLTERVSGENLIKALESAAKDLASEHPDWGLDCGTALIPVEKFGRMSTNSKGPLLFTIGAPEPGNSTYIQSDGRVSVMEVRDIYSNEMYDGFKVHTGKFLTVQEKFLTEFAEKVAKYIPHQN
jgi:hypothetical protein